MGKMFSADGPVFRFLDKTVNVIFLNILWVIFSLPVITAGASTTAMFSVMMKMARDREGYMWKGFWKAFKENFKQATKIWLVFLAVISIIVFDIYAFYVLLDLSFGRYIGALLIGILIIVLFGLVYVFPLQAQFENKVKQTIINAFYISSRNVAWTVLLMFIYALTAFAMYLFWAIAGWCIVGIGAYVCSKIYNRIFRRYIPEDKRDDY